MYPAKRYENPTILACLNNLVKFEWAAKVFVQPEDLHFFVWGTSGTHKCTLQNIMKFQQYLPV